METGDKSIYAFVPQKLDLPRAQAYCERLQVRGLDAQMGGSSAQLNQFNLLSINSTEELDFIHERVFARQYINAWVWLGQVLYEGAPQTEAGFALLMTDWTDPRKLEPTPITYGNAFICEMPTLDRYTLDLGPLSEGEIRGPYMKSGPSTYYYRDEKATFSEATTLCNAMLVTIDRETIGGFELVVVNTLGEQKRVHALVQQNGGTWVWAGTLSYTEALLPPKNKQWVLTDPQYPLVKQAKSVGESHSFVCESGGPPADARFSQGLTISPEMKAISQTTIVEGVATFEGQAYVFMPTPRLFSEAAARCRHHTQEIQGRIYDDFQLITINSTVEREVAHELVKANGGLWTWMGYVTINNTVLGDERRRPVFTKFDDAAVSPLKSVTEKHSYLCEGTLRP